jgi:hypothetical protein
VIFIYSLVFTSLVSFFAVMIIPDGARKNFYQNLIGGLAMHVAGPWTLKIVFHGFVVLVGALILAGAVNTAIVGSNGVLNRVSEDGVLAAWFRRPHPRFGTSYRIINLIALCQLVTIILSRGNVYLLGEAYAFGVIWSFVLKGLAVLVLRYTHPGSREYRVPLNAKVGRTEIPLGLGFITLTLLAIAVTNLLTKEVATVSGIAFTLVLFAVFTASEKLAGERGAAHIQLDQFHLVPGEEITPQTVGCRPGNALVLVRDYNTLYNLAAVLNRVDTDKQDVVALHVRVLERAASGDSGLMPEQLFTGDKQLLFTRALSLAESKGKTIRLALVGSNQIWDGILRAAQSLQSSTVVLGLSAKMAITEEARRAGLAWERLPDPKPQVSLEIFTPAGQEEVFYLGPHAPHLTAKEIDLLHQIWLRFSTQLGEVELHHHDVIHFALTQIENELAQGKNDAVLTRLKQHLEQIKSRRIPPL